MISLYDGKITDILPEVISENPKVQALSYALSQALKRTLGYIAKTKVFAAIDQADNEVLDLLAIELKTQYYDETLPVTVKRDLIKNTLVWYKNAGTTKTVTELITAIFGSGDIIEWFENDGEPFTFAIRTEAPITGDEVAEFSRMISKVINIRSHLTAIEFTRNVNGDCYLAGGQCAYQINKDIKEGGN